MAEKKDYLAMLDDGWRKCAEWEERQLSRLEYLSEYIFSFSTYDSFMAEVFATKALEVCEAINEEGKTYEYIKTNYLWYLQMCNMRFFAERITWGASIRGAFWDSPITLDTCGLEAVEEWKKRDPIRMFRARVTAEGKLTAAEMDAVDVQIKKDMELVLDFARKSSEPDVEVALQDIFTE